MGCGLLLPEDWPAGFRQYIVSAVQFGLAPSAGTIPSLILCARELDTNEMLPAELQIIVESDQPELALARICRMVFALDAAEESEPSVRNGAQILRHRRDGLSSGDVY